VTYTASLQDGQTSLLVFSTGRMESGDLQWRHRKMIFRADLAGLPLDDSGVEAGARGGAAAAGLGPATIPGAGAGFAGGAAFWAGAGARGEGAGRWGWS
jgi:hypothetical protein